MLVVVDRDPRVIGPRRRGPPTAGRPAPASSCGRVGRRAQALAEPPVAAGHDLRPGRRHLTREHRDVRRRAARPHPRDAGGPCRPLLGQRRLAVAGAGDQHPHLRPRAIERPDQPRTLEDAAPPQRRLRKPGHLVDRRGYNRSLHRVKWAPAGDWGCGRGRPAVRPPDADAARRGLPRAGPPR